MLGKIPRERETASVKVQHQKRPKQRRKSIMCKGPEGGSARRPLQLELREPREVKAGGHQTRRVGGSGSAG